MKITVSTLKGLLYLKKNRVEKEERDRKEGGQ